MRWIPLRTRTRFATLRVADAGNSEVAAVGVLSHEVDEVDSALDSLVGLLGEGDPERDLSVGGANASSGAQVLVGKSPRGTDGLVGVRGVALVSRLGVHHPSEHGMHGHVEGMLAARRGTLNFVLLVIGVQAKQFNLDRVFMDVLDINTLTFGGKGLIHDTVVSVLEISTGFHHDRLSHEVVRDLRRLLCNNGNGQHQKQSALQHRF